MTHLSAEQEIYEVDPARLAPGEWCHRVEKTLEQGDIAASCSADRIGLGEPVRKPFIWRGALMVCVSILYRDGAVYAAEAYRLTAARFFDGTPVTYSAKTGDGGESARADPQGFYHGMSTRYAGDAYVLAGPPVEFVPGRSEQLPLL